MNNPSTPRAGIAMLVLAAVLLSGPGASAENREKKANSTVSKSNRTAKNASKTELPPVAVAAAVLPATSAAPEEALRLSLEDAILMGLENNQELSVQRLAPAIRQIQEEVERSVFDPVFSAQTSYQTAKTSLGSQGDGSTTDLAKGDVSLQTFLPTGTSIGLTGNAQHTDPSFPGGSSNTGAGLNVNQSLLREFGTRVNLASLRQARLDTRISQYELQGVAQSLVANLETTYWDYFLARRQLEIYQDSLQLALRQLEEAEERIRVGKLAESERAAAQAEAALRKEDLINARSTLEKTKLLLIRLLNPGTPGMWTREVHLLDEPAFLDAPLEDAEIHVHYALQNRPDLNQARLGIEKNDLDLVKTRNGLLPVLDVFISLGGTGYAGSFGDSLGNIFDDNYDIQGGFRFEMPLGNRAPRAQHRRAELTREQSELSLQNMMQLAQVDVRTACLEVLRAREQIEATRATRELQEVNVRTETEKFRVGRSTSLLVSQAQRDLLSAQIAEVQAVVTFRQALASLYRLEGSILDRHGISAETDERDANHPAESK